MKNPIKRLQRNVESDNTAPNIFKLKIKISKLLATQQREPSKIMPMTTTFEKQVDTEKSQGTPEQKALPTKERKRESTVTRTAKAKCHCFTRNGDGHIYDFLGGRFGHLKRLATKVGATLSKNSYSPTALGLIRFKPDLVDLGKDEDVETTWILQKRNLPRPPFKVMVWQPFESVHDRTAEVEMHVSRLCPLSAKEINALLIGMNDFDGFAATSRGVIESIEIVK